MIHNGSPVGVDAAAAAWCEENGIPQIVHSPDAARGSSAERDSHLAMLAEEPEVVVSFTIADLDNLNNITPLPVTDLAVEQGKFGILYYMAHPGEFPYVDPLSPEAGHVPEEEPWQETPPLPVPPQ